MSWKNTDVLDEYLLTVNKASIDWNSLNADAQGRQQGKDRLVKSAIETSQGKEIVVLLMHDMYGKEETAHALPEIIEYYIEAGYEFKVLV